MAASKVTDLRKRRIERLAADLAPHLLHGHAIVEVDLVDSVDEWRAAARLAAQQRGWRVRTGFNRGRLRVFAVRVDPELEQGWSGTS